MRTRHIGAALFALALLNVAPSVRADTSRKLGAAFHARVEETRRRLGAEEFWVVYELEKPQPPVTICCGGSRGVFYGSLSDFGSDRDGACRIDKQAHGWSVQHDRPGGPLRVFLRIERGTVDDLRTFSASCSLEAPSDPVEPWKNVTAEESATWLAAIVQHDAQEDSVRERALMAIAHHPIPEATRLLEGWAAAPSFTDLQRNAIFWLGEARGDSGLAALERLLNSNLGPEGRQQIAFALSLNEAPNAIDRLIRMARYEDSGTVRQDALFWMSQVAGKRAGEVLVGAIEDDPEIEVKKKAVFGLSQLPGNEGFELLTKVYLENPHPQIRKEALFWIGQSGRPEALNFLESVLQGR